MSLEQETATLKRAVDDKDVENPEDEEDAGWIGPLPTEQSAASKPKKKKGFFIINFLKLQVILIIYCFLN